MDITYPIDRLLSNPRIFYAMSNMLHGPDADTLRNAFYELIEYDFGDYEDPEDIEFPGDEINFSINEDGEVQITLDTGLASVLKPVEGETRGHITNDHEMSATTAIYDRIITALVAANPEFQNNIALCSPPTPGNSYLRSEDGERFEGYFHLLTEPEREFTFNVEIIDVNQDILVATYQPTYRKPEK